MTNLGSSLAAIVTDRNTWQSRANSAWGSTRVWNSGTSFEAAYNAEVTLYNNEVTSYNSMVTDRDTWQSRANSAWGSSRVWNSGESWEAAYNRVLPPAGAQRFQAPVSGPNVGAGATVTFTYGVATDTTLAATNNSTSVSIPKAGTYVVTLIAQYSGGSNNNNAVTLTLLKTGAQVDQRVSYTPPVGTQKTITVATYYQGTFAASDTVSATLASAFDAITLVSGQLNITFVPNQTNPH